MLNRVTAAIAILVVTDDEPVVYPFGWLQMNYTTISVLILEVEEPVFAVLGIYPCTLVRAVYLLVLSLCHTHILLVRTVWILGTQFYLPAILYSARRTHDIIISVALVEFGSLNGWLVFMTIIYDA